nr:hypothetical protein [Tanacetum cinerariifolium]
MPLATTRHRPPPSWSPHHSSPIASSPSWTWLNSRCHHQHHHIHAPTKPLPSSSLPSPLHYNCHPAANIILTITTATLVISAPRGAQRKGRLFDAVEAGSSLGGCLFRLGSAAIEDVGVLG